MRPATAAAQALCVSFLAVFGVTACAQEAGRPTVTEPRLLEPRSGVEYTCGGATPQSTCLAYHGPLSEATGVCGPGYGSCFELSYGAEARAVMADDQGDFPRTLFLWTKGTLTGGNACTLSTQGQKTRVDLRDGYIKAAPKLTTAEHLYYEHFASNPTGCLAWVECKIY